MSNILTVGAIQDIFDPNIRNPEKPVLQIAKVIQSDYSHPRPQRVKVAFNDGCELTQGIIPVNLVERVSGDIKKGQLLRLTHYNCIIKNSLESQETLKIIIVINYEMANSGLYQIFSNLSRVKTTKRTSPHNKSLQHSITSGPSYTIGEEFFPINALSPYFNSWKIEAIVGTKTDIKPWQSDHGSGKWFAVVLFDSSGEIRATAFEDADNFYNQLQIGKLYSISKAKIRMANKKYSTVKNDYELILGRETIITEVLNKDSHGFIPFNFVKIVDLIEYEKNDIIDVIGIVIKVSDIQEITTRTTRKNVNKRCITIVDQSKYQITLSLWGLQAEKFNSSILNHIIACKNVRVVEFQGRNLSAIFDSTIIIDPNIQETNELRDWYNSHGTHSKFTSLNTSSSTVQYVDDIKTLDQIKYEKLGQGNNLDYFSTLVTVLNIKKGNILYPACPTCSKKVIEDVSEWHCAKCSRSYPKPEYRYIIAAVVADFTGDVILRFFNDSALSIMNCEAKELVRLEAEDRDNYDATLEKACFKPYIIKCRAKTETYEGRSIIRYSAMSVIKIDYARRAKRLHQLINEMEDSFLS
ncbi:5116_t:CDS:1 [Cetraspora pellucida]|uniref:Replication protein A subunit n=1 Tax=Cetraspora pellucida TaxID=1433469 RepID=A0A9N9BWI8_9GLOM|nr:5116_t:CDS:1 [Cetraspora pellucida]